MDAIEIGGFGETFYGVAVHDIPDDSDRICEIGVDRGHSLDYFRAKHKTGKVAEVRVFIRQKDPEPPTVVLFGGWF